MHSDVSTKVQQATHGLQMPIHTQFYRPGIWTNKVGHTDLVFDVRSGFASGSVRARLQVSVCNGYDYATLVVSQLIRTFWPHVTLKSKSNPTLLYIHVRCTHDANLVKH